MKLGYYLERVQHLNEMLLTEMAENGVDLRREMTETELDELQQERDKHDRKKQS